MRTDVVQENGQPGPNSPTTPFGAWLHQAREKRQLTMTAVARSAGVDHVYISRIESGVAKHPSRSVVVRIGQAVGAAPGEALLAARYLPYEIESIAGPAFASLANSYPNLPEAGRLYVMSLFQGAADLAKSMIEGAEALAVQQA